MASSGGQTLNYDNLMTKKLQKAINRTISFEKTLVLFIARNKHAFGLSAIAFFVFIFNYEAIFGLRVLVLDDLARYQDAINGKIFSGTEVWWQLGSYTKAINKYLMLVDIHFARLFHVIVFLIPLSYLVFYLNHVYFKMNYLPALTSAILVNVLPYQIFIPFFLDGNYPLVGLIFVFLSLILSLEYLKTGRFLLLIPITFLWLQANYAFSEYPFFILMPILLLFFIYKKKSKREKVYLFLIYFAITFHKLIIYADSPARNAAAVQALSFDIILERLISFINWSSIIPAPFHMNRFVFSMAHTYLTVIIFIAFILAGLFVVFKHNRKSSNENKALIVFYLAIMVSVVIPFIFFSPYFSTRYFFVAYLFLYVVFIFSIDLMVRKLGQTLQYIKYVSALILLILVFAAGLQRHIYQVQWQYVHNNKFKVICNQLKDLGEISSGSQIIITGDNVGTGEHYIWSSGYLSYCLGKPDISGVIGKEYPFYEPFLTNQRNYGFNMKGLDINKPTYVLRRLGGAFHYPKFLLRWDDKDDEHSPWVIYKLNPLENKLERFASGDGVEAYKNKLKSKGLLPNEILWGGYDQERDWTKIEFVSHVVDDLVMEFRNSYVQPEEPFGHPEWTFNIWLNPSLPIPNDSPYHNHYTILQGESKTNFLGLNNYGGLTVYSNLITGYNFNRPGWHFVSFLYSDNVLTAMVNAENVGSKSIQNPLLTPMIRRIGQRGDVMHHFNGKMMKAQLWDRALSQSEIEIIMHSGLSGKESGLVGYWPLDNVVFIDGAKKTLDLSPSKNHGILGDNLFLVNIADTVIVRNF
jgi:hypothetical protein